MKTNNPSHAPKVQKFYKASSKLIQLYHFRLSANGIPQSQTQSVLLCPPKHHLPQPYRVGWNSVALREVQFKEKKKKSLVPSCLHAHGSCFQNVLSSPCHYRLGFHSPAQLQMVSSAGILGVINQRQHPCWGTGSSRCLIHPGLPPRAASSPRHQRHRLLLCLDAPACSLFQGSWCCILG